MQTVIRGACQLKVTRSRMAPGSSAGTGDRWTSRLPVEAVPPPYHLFRRGIEAGLLPYAAAYHWRSQSPAFTGSLLVHRPPVPAELPGAICDRVTCSWLAPSVTVCIPFSMPVGLPYTWAASHPAW